MINQKIGEILRRVADILEIQDVQFKPTAYRRAAESVESYPEDLEGIYNKKGIEGLKEIPNIGEHLAVKISEIIETGKLRYYENLKKEIPVDIEELRQISGLGPKKIKLLYEKLKIKNVNELKKAISLRKLRNISSLGEKTEENLKKEIEFIESFGRKRFLLGFVWNDVLKLIDWLKKNEFVDYAEPAGSFRRRKETIGDLDILASSKYPEKAMDYFIRFEGIKRIIAKGKTKTTVVLQNGMHVDLRVLEKKSFGAGLQYFTGNKEHNIELRKIAISKGYKLSEYGLFKGEKNVASGNEKDIYNKLGIDYIEPEMRENTGEIEAAKKHKLPKLVEMDDIKSNLHIHTDYSDGSNSAEEMIKKCAESGYEYIAISDHLGNLKIANAMNEKRFYKQEKEIELLRKKYSLPIIHGAEIDIKENGRFDIPNSFLKKIDFVIAGLHSGLHQPRNKITSRVLDAMENENIDMIAHPSARLINERQTGVDLSKVIENASRRKIILEINSNPSRADLDGIHIKEAINKNVKLAISTDAHAVSHLDFIKFGVFQARRGWAEKKNILNCLSYEEFMKRLK